MNAIVVGTDGSPGAEAAVQKVIEVLPGDGLTVHLVCAYPSKSALERVGLTARQDPTDLRGVAADVLARDERRFTEAGFAVQKHVREGDAAHVLIDVAGEQDAELIVVGARGHRPAALRARERGGQAGPPRPEEPADRAGGLSGHARSITAAPWKRPARRSSSASPARSSGYVVTVVRTGTSGASARKSAPSPRVRLATERIDRSPQRSAYGNDGMSLMWMPAHTTAPPFASARSASGTSAPAGAKTIAASSSSGGRSPDSPTHSAP